MKKTVVKKLSSAGVFTTLVSLSSCVWAQSFVTEHGSSAQITSPAASAPAPGGTASQAATNQSASNSGPYVEDHASGSGSSSISQNPCLTSISEFDDSLMTDEEKLQVLMLQQEILLGGISECNQTQATALTAAAGQGGGGGGGGNSSGGGSGQEGSANGSGTTGQTGGSTEQTLQTGSGSGGEEGTGTAQAGGLPGGVGKPVGNRVETDAMKPMCDDFRQAAAKAKNAADREYEVSEGRKLGCNI